MAHQSNIAQIAKALAEIGVKSIDAGFPVCAPSEVEAIRRIVREVEGPVVISALCRTLRGDIDTLVEQLDQARERDLRLAQRAADRVRQRVEPQTWCAYWRTAIEGAAAKDVAAELHLSVTAVYMAKRRVGRMLHDEGARLRGQGAESEGGRP